MGQSGEPPDAKVEPASIGGELGGAAGESQFAHYVSRWTTVEAWFSRLRHALGGRPLDASKVHRRLPVLILILLSLLPLVWTYPFNTILYGQDSFGFTGLFQYNFDPFIQYNSIFYAAFPIPDLTPGFYLRAGWQLLASLGLSYPVAERTILVLLTLEGVVGVFDLMGTLNRINGTPYSAHLGSKTIAALFFIMNPFTLTVTYWHLANWTLFLMFCPLLLSLLLRIVYLDRKQTSPLRVCAVITLGILTGPGVASSFAIDIGLLLVFSLTLVIVRVVRSEEKGAAGARKLVLITIIGAAIVLWATLPYYLLPHPAYAVNNYVTASNVIQTLNRESSATTVLSVMSLFAFNWVTQVPNAYPWSNHGEILALLSIPFIAVQVLCALLIPKVKGLGPLYVLGLLLIILMTGSQPPFGPVNSFLVGVGGPFLVLAGGFYLIGDVYVVFVACTVFILASRFSLITSPDPHPDAFGSGKRPSRLTSGEARAEHSHRRTRRTRNLTPRPAAILRASCVVTLVLVTPIWVPFLSGSVYQRTGPNIDEFAIPPDWTALQTYFNTNYSGPSSYVLILPMSTSIARSVDVGQGSFTDSGGIVASFIPYPVIWANSSPVVSALDNLIDGREYVSLRILLDNLHVGFVLIDPYANLSNPQMSESSSGADWDGTWTTSSLAAAFGPPVDVGSFVVFRVPNPVPIVETVNKLNLVNTSSLEEYLSVLASLNPANSSLARSLALSNWCTCSIPGAARLTPMFVTSSPDILTIPTGDQFMLVNQTGNTLWESANSSIAPYAGTSYNSTDRTLSISNLPITDSKSPSNVSTNMNLSSSGYTSPAGSVSYLDLKPTVSGSLVVIANFTITQMNSSNWIDQYDQRGSLTLLTQIYVNQATSDYTLSLAAYYEGRAFAWANTAIPPGMIGTTPTTLTTWVDPSTLAASIRSNGQSVNSSLLEFVGTANITSNPGHNLSNEPTSYPSSSASNVSFYSYFPGLDVQNISVANPSLVHLVLVDTGGPLGSSIPSKVMMELDGDYTVTFALGAPGTTAYVILGYGYSPLWEVSSGDAGTSWVIGNLLDSVAQVLIPNGSHGSITVHLKFAVLLDDGLYASWAELSAMGVVIAVWALRGRKCASR